jgi:hypothetical protein
MKGSIKEVVQHFENVLPSFRKKLDDAAAEIVR